MGVYRRTSAGLDGLVNLIKPRTTCAVILHLDGNFAWLLRGSPPKSFRSRRAAPRSSAGKAWSRRDPHNSAPSGQFRELGRIKPSGGRLQNGPMADEPTREQSSPINVDGLGFKEILDIPKTERRRWALRLRMLALSMWRRWPRCLRGPARWHRGALLPQPRNQARRSRCSPL